MSNSVSSETRAAADEVAVTLNQQGYSIAQASDFYTTSFVEFAARAPGRALEIGAAYGDASFQLLKRGVSVIVNDSDQRHLDVLRARTPPEQQSLLQLAPGRFPDEIALAPGSLGAILIARVMHFMTPREIEASLVKLLDSLAPGGKAFAVVDTPYLKCISPSFLPAYLERKASGDKWPGWCENFKEALTSEFRDAPEFRDHVPTSAHFLDEETFPRLFSQAGFVIEAASFIPRPYFPAAIRLDGRESFGLIAVKP